MLTLIPLWKKNYIFQDKRINETGIILYFVQSL